MLKNLFLSCSLLLAIYANSQINKGAILLGGDLGFSSNSNKTNNPSSTSKSTGLSFSPVYARAVKQNIFIGGSLNYRYNKYENNLSQKTKEYTIGAGVFTRKYKQVSKKFYAFMQAGLRTSWRWNETNPNTNFHQKSFSTSASITPGVSYNISKKVYLEAGLANVAALDYSSSKNTDNTTQFVSTNRAFSFSSSLGAFASSLYFGFRFILPG